MDFPDTLTAIELFMRRAGQLDTIGFPDNVDDPLRILRRKMLVDPAEGEVSEYVEAEFANDRVEVLDALIDIIWIAWGTALAYYGPEVANAAAYEVTRSNLDKVYPLVNRREDGKILKPSDWVAPRIREILQEAGLVA